MRIINADEMKNYIDCGHLRNPNELCFSELDVVRMLDKMTTVDAEPVRHGRWVLVNKDLSECSACGMIRNIHTQFAWAYCPNCGAKMDLEE